MRKRSLLVLLLILSLLLAGCSKEGDPGTTRPVETEPTATYDWMAGESPVPNVRMGVLRAGISSSDFTVSPSGVYFLPELINTDDRYVLYADHGSDTLIKLCGRADCSHDTSDCNAYFRSGSCLTYDNGYLYVVSGNGSEEQCKLVRMDPDGSNHITLLDFLAFAKERGGDYVECNMITEGVCLFSVYCWKDTGGGSLSGTHDGYYYYKLDGSMEKPERAYIGGLACYNCGDVILTYSPEAQNGGEYGSYWDWDQETNSATYLTDHSGQPGWYGKDEAYYFKDGAICRLTYATQTEEVMVDTGLEGDYYLFSFPDCMAVAARGLKATADSNLYIYNWAFELVDTVEIKYSHDYAMEHLLIAETAERLILTDEYNGLPRYFIEKSELGTGNVQIHSFVYD